LREKKRYLKIKGKEQEKAEKAILDYIGILGFAKASPVWVKNDILAVNRKEADKVKAGLLLEGIEVKKVSGTLKSIR
jgi:RNase P/RNase MRP subunit POP5